MFNAFTFVRFRTFGFFGSSLPAIPAFLACTSACAALTLRFTHKINSIISSASYWLVISIHLGKNQAEWISLYEK
jgi:branched-subunit amino acid permease